MKHRSIVILLIAAFLWTGMGFISPAGLEAAGGRGKGAGELPKALKGVRVKDAFIPSAGKPAGVIKSVVGHVVVAREGLKEAYYSAAGDRLYEHDTLFTLKGSRCRFRLNGEDVVTMGEGTRIAISGFGLDKARGTKRSAFKMSKGKAMFYALKLFRYKGAAMTVETPTAVVGVRGTKWGVEIVELDGKPTASMPILVADLSDTGFRYLAQANPPNVQTNVYSFEGQIQVTSSTTGQTTTLSSGQGLNAGGAGLGGTFQTPPGVAQQFSSDTSAPGGNGGGTSSSGTTTGGGGTTTTTTTGNGGTTTTTTPDTSTVAQDQTTKDASTTATDPVTDPGTNASGSQVGYVSGMLMNRTGSSLAEIFVSKNRQDFDTRIWARGAKDTSKDYIRVDTENWSTEGDCAKWVMFESGTKNSGDLGTSHVISHTTTSEITLESSRMEWGYWTMPDYFTVDGSNYAVDYKGWWIHGPSTQNSSSLTGVVHYSGNAYGTYWSSSSSGAKDDMTGSFSSDVNLGSGAISDFGLTVGSGSTYASISGASGTIGSDAHFSITGGTWNLNGTTPTYQMAYGSLYGSSAQYMGGAWGMATASAGATGIFEGKKEHLGYFVGMLIYDPDGIYLKNFSITKTIKDFQSTVISAEDPFTTGHSMTADGSSSYLDPTIKTVNIVGGSWTGAKTVSHTGLGSNDYTEWGYWTQPEAMTINSTNYYYDTKGYYVHGTQTTDAQMAALKAANVTATYNGNAFGRYLTTSGGIDMTGSFSASVNFAASSNQITNFSMSVQNSSYEKSASITGGYGSFTESSSQFTLTGASSVSITGGSTPSQKTYGSVYGPSGQAIGGVWAISGGGKNAAGMFQGTKTGDLY